MCQRCQQNEKECKLVPEENHHDVSSQIENISQKLRNCCKHFFTEFNDPHPNYTETVINNDLYEARNNKTQRDAGSDRRTKNTEVHKEHSDKSEHTKSPSGRSLTKKPKSPFNTGNISKSPSYRTSPRTTVTKTSNGRSLENSSPGKHQNRTPTRKDKGFHKKPSARLLNLSQPRRREDCNGKSNPFDVCKTALSYTLTKRTESLATPKVAVLNKPKSDFRLRPMSAKPSDRLLELARPKSRACNMENPNSNGVSANALRYQASSRIKKLSVPKTCTPALRANVSPRLVKLPNSNKVPIEALLNQVSSLIKELSVLDTYTGVRGISPSALNAKASPRIMKLAQPKEGKSIKEDPFAFKVKSEALHYKASDRILALSLPNLNGTTKKPDSFRSVSPVALRAKASKRVMELARPKSRPDSMNLKDSAYTVNPNAFIAKSSKQIRKLAQRPKVDHSRTLQ